MYLEKYSVGKIYNFVENNIYFKDLNSLEQLRDLSIILQYYLSHKKELYTFNKEITKNILNCYSLMLKNIKKIDRGQVDYIMGNFFFLIDKDKENYEINTSELEFAMRSIMFMFEEFKLKYFKIIIKEIILALEPIRDYVEIRIKERDLLN